jgi:hypothetical protein
MLRQLPEWNVPDQPHSLIRMLVLLLAWFGDDDQTRMHAVSVDEKEGPGRLDACDIYAMPWTDRQSSWNLAGGSIRRRMRMR